MKKIAIIGSGISGLTCAYLLNPKYDIEVFEAGDYIGGHTATKEVLYAGKTWRIDTGFIVEIAEKAVSLPLSGSKNTEPAKIL